MDSWKSLNLHLENLLPGIVTLVLIAHLLPRATISHFMNNPVFTNEIARGSTFIAVAYLVGVIVVAFCRVLDKASARLTRYWGLRWFAIDGIRRSEIRMMNSREANHHYREQIRLALSSGNSEVKAEIAKRRERIHLLRSTLIPAVLGVWALQLAWPYKLGLSLAAGVLILLLYTYLEIAVYDEATLIVDDCH